VKALSAGKSRLTPGLRREQIEALTLAMLEDVVAATRGVPGIDETRVVTPDPTVAKVAEAAGAVGMLRSDPGLNPALERAAAELAERGLERLLVLLGDVAGARSRDLAEMFAALAGLGGRGAVLAPSRDGGTAALLLSPHDLLPNRFGPDSAQAHRQVAAARHIPFRELSLPSLAIDLDRLEDARELLARGPREAPHTRALLRRLGLGEAR